MPKVSIIVPVYNAESGIQRCVDSILAQEFKDFELILVDDGSKDASPAMLDAYAKEDSRVRVIHQANSGVSTTRNNALDAAQGEYVQFLDADDWIAPEATRLLVRGMEDHDADMVIADFYRVIDDRVAEKGDIDAFDIISREEYAHYLMENPADFYYGVVWNKLYKRSIIEEHELRMDPEISWSEDFIFNLEYVLHCERIFPLRTPIYYYVKTEGSLVTQGDMASTVKMKLNVIDYYKDFFRRLSPSEYSQRRAQIYRFYVSFAGDGGATPLMPGTKRLGEERGIVNFNPAMEVSTLANSYYYGKLYDRRMTEVARQYDLELADVKVLALLKRSNAFAGRGEIADFLGVTHHVVAVSVTRLLTKGLVTVENVRADKHGQYLHIFMTEDAEGVSEAIEQSFHDIDDASFSGFTPEEVETYKAMSLRMRKNVAAALKA